IVAAESHCRFGAVAGKWVKTFSGPAGEQYSQCILHNFLRTIFLRIIFCRPFFAWPLQTAGDSWAPEIYASRKKVNRRSTASAGDIQEFSAMQLRRWRCAETSGS